MKLVTEHLGEIILAIAGVALIVGLILAFRQPIGDFFSDIIGKLTDVGEGSNLWSVDSTFTATPNP